MPFLRNHRGQREAYSPVRLSAFLSLIYQTARSGERLDRARPAIMRHVQSIWTRLETTYGGGPDDEWSAASIHQIIDAELSSQIDLHEAWLEIKSKETRISSRAGADEDPRQIAQKTLQANIAVRQAGHIRAQEEGEHGGRYRPPASQTVRMAQGLNGAVDPVWGIVLPAPDEEHIGTNGMGGSKNSWTDAYQTPGAGTARNVLRPEEDFLPSTLTMGLGKETGIVESAGKKIGSIGIPDWAQGAKDRRSVVIREIRRSVWLSWWRALGPDMGSLWPARAWEYQLLACGQDQQRRDPISWWTWWEDQIDVLQKDVPSAYLLRNALHAFRRRAACLGIPWWNLLEKEASRHSADGNAENGHTSFDLGEIPEEGWYREIGVKHLRTVMSRAHAQTRWDWRAIGGALKKRADDQMDWVGWQDMVDAGALWPIQIGGPVVGQNEQRALPLAEAREMPQWAWMRVAMALAAQETDITDEKRTENAVSFYEAMTQLWVMPSSSALREAGRPNPRYLEDQAWEVPDQFEGIQDVVHHTAVDTAWNGTCSSTWSRVRSNGAPVRWGRRVSSGVCDFLRTIDRHMRSQGRQGNDRPATALLHAWHLDVEEFLRLPQNGGDRVQCALIVPDLFFKRLADNEPWTLFDPSIYGEALDDTRGTAGYLAAEQAVAVRAQVAPWAHRIVSTKRLWTTMVEQCRLGRLNLVFGDNDRAFTPADTPVVHGLDGVGVFPLPTHVQAQRIQAALENEGQSARGGNISATPDAQAARRAARMDQAVPRRVSWPALAVNVAAFVSPDGEPNLDAWSRAVRWALWAAERMYESAERGQSGMPPASRLARPICLGAIGFYEAIERATNAQGRGPDGVDDWVARIGETWTALIIAEDKRLATERGVAPLWLQDIVPTRTFQPAQAVRALRAARDGGVRVQEPRAAILKELFSTITGYRFSVRSVWAPFRTAARWAGVTPGGLGTLAPTEWMPDMEGTWRLAPTAFLKNDILAHPQDHAPAALFRYPDQPRRWPERVVRMCVPDSEEWERRMAHAALLRPWIDQGICLTLPTRLKNDKLSVLIRRAWWSGVSNIRFEDLLPSSRPGLDENDEEFNQRAENNEASSQSNQEE
jgi:hypothetical protein